MKRSLTNGLDPIWRSGRSARRPEGSALVNFAPVALALTLGYALAVSLLDRDDSSGGDARAVAIVVATPGLGMTLRDPGGLVHTLGRGLQYLSWMRIALGALAVRLVWVLASDVKQTSDFGNYDRMAREISGGQYLVNPGLPTGPSIMFAVHYLVFGYMPLAPQLTLVLLSTAQVLLVYSLLLKTTANKPAALLGATILAIWPEHILYVNLLGSDVLFSTLVLLAAWMLTLSSGSRPRRDLAAVFAAGVVLGCSHWVRNTAFVFLAASLLFLALHDRWRFKRRAAAVGALSAGFLLPVLPLLYLQLLGDRISVTNSLPNRRLEPLRRGQLHQSGHVEQAGRGAHRWARRCSDAFGGASSRRSQPDRRGDGATANRGTTGCHQIRHHRGQPRGMRLDHQPAAPGRSLVHVTPENLAIYKEGARAHGGRRRLIHP